MRPMDAGGTDRVRRIAVLGGTSRYEYQDDLPAVPGDVRTIGTALGGLGYHIQEPLLDLTASGFQSALADWAESEDRVDDAVVLYYTGHGDYDHDRHCLLFTDSRTGKLAGTALATEDVLRVVAENGVERLLLIVDTCAAGHGGADAVRTYAQELCVRLSGSRAAGSGRIPELSVIVAARGTEEANDGAFTRAFAEAVDDPRLGGNRQRQLFLPELVGRINEALTANGDFQHAAYATPGGEGFPFFPNPRYVPDLPGQAEVPMDLAEQRTWLTPEGIRRRNELRSHFAPRGRGAAHGEDSYFTGRTAALAQLGGWLDGAPGSPERHVVVTGSAGVGKSSLLGRLVLLADSEERRSLPDLPAGAALPRGHIHTSIHARHKTLEEIAAGIADAAGLPDEGPGALLEALARRTEPLVVVIDALDEAGTAYGDTEPVRVAETLLRPLAETGCVRMLIGARPHVVDALGTAFTRLDLDDPRWTGTDDIAAYARKLLLSPDGPASRSAYDAAGPVLTALAEEIARRSGGVYLVARLLARLIAVQDQPLDVTVEDWRRRLPDSLFAADGPAPRREAAAPSQHVQDRPASASGTSETADRDRLAGIADTSHANTADTADAGDIADAGEAPCFSDTPSASNTPNATNSSGSSRTTESTAAGFAFRWDLRTRLGEREPIGRGLLTALALAEGAGLPLGAVWRAMAGALTGGEVTFEDVHWILRAGAAHLVEETDEDNRSVYRLFHESFADELRAAMEPQAPERVAGALLALVPFDPATGARDWPAADPYLHQHLASHLAPHGLLDDILLDPLYLVTAERTALQRGLLTVRTARAIAVRSVYERVAPHLAAQPDLLSRAALLRLAALQAGERELADEVSARMPGLPWTAEWGHLYDPPDHHRTLDEFPGGLRDIRMLYGDGRPLLATLEVAGRIRLWDLNVCLPLGELPVAGAGRPVGITACRTVSSPWLLVSTGPEDQGPRELRVWDSRSRTPWGAAVRGEPEALALVEVGDTVVAGIVEADGSVKLIDMADGREVRRLSVPESATWAADARATERRRARRAADRRSDQGFAGAALALGMRDGQLKVALAMDGHHSFESDEGRKGCTVLRWDVLPGAGWGAAHPRTSELHGERLRDLMVSDDQVCAATEMDTPPATKNPVFVHDQELVELSRWKLHGWARDSFLPVGDTALAVLSTGDTGFSIRTLGGAAKPVTLSEGWMDRSVAVEAMQTVPGRVLLAQLRASPSAVAVREVSLGTTPEPIVARPEPRPPAIRQVAVGVSRDEPAVLIRTSQVTLLEARTGRVKATAPLPGPLMGTAMAVSPGIPDGLLCWYVLRNGRGRVLDALGKRATVLAPYGPPLRRAGRDALRRFLRTEDVGSSHDGTMHAAVTGKSKNDVLVVATERQLASWRLRGRRYFIYRAQTNQWDDFLSIYSPLLGSQDLRVATSADDIYIAWYSSVPEELPPSSIEPGAPVNSPLFPQDPVFAVRHYPSGTVVHRLGEGVRRPVRKSRRSRDGLILPGGIDGFDLTNLGGEVLVGELASRTVTVRRIPAGDLLWQTELPERPHGGEYSLLRLRQVGSRGAALAVDTEGGISVIDFTTGRFLFRIPMNATVEEIHAMPDGWLAVETDTGIFCLSFPSPGRD
ncbi:AAA family ATPase [Streptomyces sp. NPDC059788]|uniref:AAA family ATPase n=1 Tax=Streptomyces sp. NPDC059788 TaxID=3346948 RepID=UPI00364B946A